MHNQIDIAVKVNWPGGSVTATRVFLRIFDPDSDSSNIVEDPNGNDPDDNIVAGGESLLSGGVLTTLFNELPVAAELVVRRTSMVIYGPQPGNNFIVAASGRKANVDAMEFKNDGTTLLKQAGGSEVPENVKTKRLTVWRTLHVEQDAMRAPEPDDPDSVFNGAGVMTGPNRADDDVAPPLVDGHLVNPSLALLTTEMKRAYVKVVPLPPGSESTTRFYHYLAESPGGNLHGMEAQQIFSSPTFWAVQIFAAYENSVANDYDPIGAAEEANSLGNSFRGLSGTANIFLETIRDVSANKTFTDDLGTIYHTVDAETLRQRVVLHEIIHLFGYVEDDVLVMNYDVAMYGTAAQNQLAGVLIRQIMLAAKPQQLG